MALRTCPMCQTAAEPKTDGDRELCPKCDLQLPPANGKSPDPPERPRSKAVTARREYRRPERTATSSGKVGGFGLSVLLLVGAFVLLILFYAAVFFVKTQMTTPTKPGGTTRGNGQPNNPWGGPPPQQKW